MKTVIFSAIILVIPLMGMGASVALPPMGLSPTCPFCGNNDYVVIDNEFTERLNENVYKCFEHEKYYISMSNIETIYELGLIWRSREDVIDASNKIEEGRLKAEVDRMKSFGWSQDQINRILKGYILIGDTREIVCEAWGRPEDINRTTTTYGTSEQWVYDLGCYVYFENGTVTAIQD